MLIMVSPPPNHNNWIKITNINSNSNSFTNLINHRYLFSAYLFIYLFIFENSLNLFLCLHLVIKSHLWFNRLPGSKNNIICIFSSRCKLHLPSKQLGVVDLFNILHWIFRVKPIFFNFQNVWIKLFDFSSVHERTNEYDYHIYSTPPLGQDMTQVYQVWIQSFPSPRLVALPRLKNLVCPTIYP